MQRMAAHDYRRFHCNRAAVRSMRWHGQRKIRMLRLRLYAFTRAGAGVCSRMLRMAALLVLTRC